MSLLKIARLGHPVLLRRAEPVADPMAPEIRRLVMDMGATMLDAQGLGLAAPQVHESLRIFVWRQGKDGVAALINPEITLLDPADEVGFEGCLSIPGLRGAVRRSRRVGFRGFSLDGRVVEGDAEGLLARVMQHECDHLDGVLYLMRMHDLSLLGFTEELAQHPPTPAETETIA
ncbi:peptide deformylase [Humitalea sp. 24SJ18S-53]|uniref:peptide deformylase n=1 Tax=Humitalea sp. 24SJ18S-53 TaxID=3422307 RepID=UPI003D668393